MRTSSLFPAMLVVCLCLASIVQAWCLQFVDEFEHKNLLSEKTEVAVFYNLYAQGNHFRPIVQNQVDTIKGSGLLNKVDKIFYVTIGNEGKEFSPSDNEKYVHLAHYPQASEINTLSLLHQFCDANPTSKVLYFHNKGSYHPSYQNARFVSILNCYVLNPNCLETLDTHDTCGWRITPIPNPHYSGNFWWARCKYISTLVAPSAPFTNATLIEKVKTLNECMGFQDRFFSETWIGTGIHYTPADCMNATIDTSYVHNYHYLPEVAFQFCHGPHQPSGLKCETASTFAEPERFRKTIGHSNAAHRNVHCRDNRAEIIKMSNMLYGEDPHTYIEWMDRVFPMIKPPEKKLIRFTGSTVIYIVQDGLLRAVPNAKTFFALGRDFSEVENVFESEMKSFSFGAELPSA